MSAPSIVWFRNDLRLADHPALTEAVAAGPVALLYVLEEADDLRPLGGAARWWLHGSLAELADEARTLGARLLLRRGDPREILPALAAEVGAERVLVSARAGREAQVDAAVREALGDIELRETDGAYLVGGRGIATGSGGAYSVFTPFWRALEADLAARPPREPLDAPEASDAGAGGGARDDLDDWGLLPTAPDWAGGLRDRWDPGERAADAALADFLEERLQAYGDDADWPGADGASALSPRLRWGEISPHQVWAAVDRRRSGSAAFLRQLGWREFAAHLADAFPQVETKNWRSQFDAFPWSWDETPELDAWRAGTTGIDLVDAGMRELWQTGVMHNRIRMVTASFLTKNLLTHWRVGEQWFWDTLVDADPVINGFSWQWVAGSGADAAPYFRILNPERQAERFDPDRRYIRRWVPDDELRPEPIVNLKESRRAALDASEATKRR